MRVTIVAATLAATDSAHATLFTVVSWTEGEVSVSARPAASYA